jgi:ribulose-5-phosphate 4-epimerase/fuculose-1-phosphate aldolase
MSASLSLARRETVERALEGSMTRQLQSCLHELAVANRIFANQGITDAFGHVSARHPFQPNRYLLSCARPPELIQVSDLIEFTLDGEPVHSTNAEMYSERVIHGEIYKARPDVMAVCHHHCSSILPFCITGEQLVPAYHLGASIGPEASLWDQRDEFGDTSLSVETARQGASLARALGRNALVLMRRHGATVVGSSLRELVFRTVYSSRNAEYQSKAMLLGRISALSYGEIQMAGSLTNQPGVDRAWEHWVKRLDNLSR